MCMDSVDVGTVYDHNQAKHNDYDDDNDDPCQRDSVVWGSGQEVLEKKLSIWHRAQVFFDDDHS